MTSAFVRYLQDRLLIRGAMPMSSFMSECLTNPRFGYYATKRGDAILGARGDFVTSPEISPMFGEVITVYLVDKWRRLGQPASLRLLELGPGRATLMADILTRSRRSFPDFFNAIGSLSLVEVSPSLRQTQLDRLASLLPQHASLAHLDSVNDFADDSASGASGGAPPLNDLLILSHEFYDCLPANVYEQLDGVWKEKYLAWDADGDRFVFVHRKLDENVRRLFLDHRLIAPGDDVVNRKTTDTGLLGSRATSVASNKYLEVSMEALRTFEHSVTLMQRRGGAQLLIDYGNLSVNYPSLRFILGHEIVTSVDSDYIKANVGNVDLSVDVHFGPLMAIAHKMGLTETFLSSQAAFLFRNGLQPLLFRRLAACTDESTAARVVADFKRLTDDDQMGRVYKVLECTHDARTAPSAPSAPSAAKPPTIPKHRKR